MKRTLKLDLIGLTAALALPAAAYWTQVAPAQRRSLATAATVRQLQQKQREQAELQQTLSRLTPATPAATQPSLTLQPLEQLNRRLAELNDLATTHGLTIDTLEPGEPVGRDRYAVLTINLAAQGDYRACQAWLSELSVAMPDVTVAQWQLASAAADKTAPLRLTATLRWFALPKAGSR